MRAPIHMRSFWEVFLPLFVAIDPIGMLPVFVALTATLSQQRRREITFQAVAAATLISFGFLLAGNELFHVLGIDSNDFRIAGGILLLVLAILDLLIAGKPAVQEAPSSGIFPLAMPLIAGPALLTTALVLANTHPFSLVVLGMAINFLILLAVMLAAGQVSAILGRTTLQAASKLVMVLLAAIAVNFIRSGVVGIITSLNAH